MPASRLCLLLFVPALILSPGLFAQDATADSLLQLAQNPELSTADRSLAWHQLGNHYDDIKDLPAAAKATRRALELRLADEANDPDAVLVSAYNLGVYHLDLGDYERSERYLRMVTDRAPNRKAGTAYYQLGRLYGELQEFGLAETAFHAAAGLSPWADDLASRARLAATHAYAWTTKDAPENGRRALEILSGISRTELNTLEGDLRTLLLLRNGLARTYAGEYRAAMPYYQRALNHNRACCDYEDRYAEIYSNMGLNARRRGRLAEAEAFYRQSLRIDLSLSEEKPDAFVANDYDNLSTLFFYRGRFDSSLHYAMRSLGWLFPGLDPVAVAALPTEEELLDCPHRVQLLTTLHGAARARRFLGDEPEATLATFRACDLLIDALRRDQRLESSKLSWRATAVDIYAEAVAFSVRQNRPGDAFYYTEKSRSVLLLDERLERGIIALLPEKERERWLDLQSTRAYYRQQLMTPGDPSLLELNQRLSDFEDSLRLAFPAAFDQPSVSPTDAAQIRSGLETDEVFLSYFWHDSVASVVVLSREEERVVDLGPSSELERILTDFRASVSGGDTAFDAATAHAAYRSLVAPIGLPAGRRLRLSLPPELADIPFAALLTRETDPDLPYRQWPWLFRRHLTVRQWSAALYLLERSRESTRSGRIRYFAPAAPSADQPGIDDARLQLPLSGRTDELFSPNWKLRNYLGAAADRDNFLDQVERAGILHLSTHAYLGETTGAPPYFLLADSVFTAYELLRTSLVNELVVLNACQTGLGERRRGEGVASLGRAFTRSGAAAVIFSLWPVDEAASFSLFTHYYADLETGSAKGSALDEARNRYLDGQTNNELAHPYYWAGFVYYGQDEPLAERGGVWWWVLGGVVGLVLVLWFIRYAVRKTG